MAALGFQPFAAISFAPPKAISFVAPYADGMALRPVFRRPNTSSTLTQKLTFVNIVEEAQGLQKRHQPLKSLSNPVDPGRILVTIRINMGATGDSTGSAALELRAL